MTAKAYACTPGTGPKGETCGTCGHARYYAPSGKRRYYKCGLLEPTHGKGSDIKLNSPACLRWAPDVEPAS